MESTTLCESVPGRGYSASFRKSRFFSRPASRASERSSTQAGPLMTSNRSNFERLLVIKGPAWVEERSEAREAGLLKNLDLRKLAEYPLPGTDSQSVVLSIRAKEA